MTEHDWPAPFRAMTGRWRGTVRYCSGAGILLQEKQLEVRCTITERTLNIINTTTIAGEAPTSGPVEGTLGTDGIIALASPRIVGRAWASQGVVLADWSLTADPAARFFELSIIHDGGWRTRTWHHLRNGALEGVSIIEERRVA